MVHIYVITSKKTPMILSPLSRGISRVPSYSKRVSKPAYDVRPCQEL